MKRFLWPLLLAVAVLSGVVLWRRAHPPLSPREQVEARLDGLSRAVESQNVGSAASFLAPDFTYEGGGGATKKDIVEGSRGAFFEWRDVKVETSGVQTSVNGNTAQTHGNLRLTLRPSPGGALETRKGTFGFTWELRNGEWKITRARGGEDVLR